jgi:hypothetical protein
LSQSGCFIDPSGPLIDDSALRDRDAFSLEYARDGPRAAADLDSRAGEPPKGPDACPVDEGDGREIETDSAPGSKKTGAFALEKRGPLRDDAPLERQGRPGSRSLPARDPQRHIGLLALFSSASC